MADTRNILNHFHRKIICVIKMMIINMCSTLFINFLIQFINLKYFNINQL